MNTHADKTNETKSNAVANGMPVQQGLEHETFQLQDNRPEIITQRKIQEAANNSPQVTQLKEVKTLANNSPQVKQLRAVQAMTDHTANATELKEINGEETLQKKENKTGLPDNLKSGVENLSGQTLDDVQVHYNSDKPAQLNALAYAQGTDIHIAGGQEKHLPHEAWHVVQQKQGRVQPTLQMKDDLTADRNKTSNSVLQRKIIFTDIQGDDGTFFLRSGNSDRSKFANDLDEYEMALLEKAATEDSLRIRVKYNEDYVIKIIQAVKTYFKSKFSNLKTVIQNVKRRVVGNDKFVIKYNTKDFVHIYHAAVRLKVDDHTVEDMIFTGSREAKRRTAEALAIEMSNWATVVSAPGGYPYRFESAEQFVAFKTDLLAVVGKYGFPNDDVRVQGSSLRNPAAGDVDIAVFVSPAYYAGICAGKYQDRFKLTNGANVNLAALTYPQMKAMAEQVVAKDLTTYRSNGESRRASYSILTGLFSGKGEQIPALKQATLEFAAKYPDQNIESISILIRGGEFELKPDLKITI